ncbi:MAG: TonB-dependent receptor [Gemmatimonadetes bacterium]|nr:TonB-dependent receptor [Gemmatimonadota bacterium]
MTKRLWWFGLIAGMSLVGPGSTLAQTGVGRIVGRVVDAAQGVPIGGAVVELVGPPTAFRTTTGVDGRFAFQGVPAGEVGLRVRMIGYGPKLVTGVRVPSDGSVTQDVSLNAESIQLEELNVTAEAERGSVADALNEQQNSVGVVNAVTAEEIARSPDGDAAAAVQRVSGVSVQDGKFVFVRGLGERYTTTSLNGARIPSPEPERKVVPLDLFPSGLLQSITTAKTFTPDLPGDFSGAQVNIRTREFPANRQITISTSTGFNSRATSKDILRAPNAGLEWLALGASDRSLPGLVRAAGRFEPAPSQAEVNAMVGSFRNAWSAPSRSGLPNSSLSVSVGGSDRIAGQGFGYLFSGTYSYGQEIQASQRRAYALPLAAPGSVAEIDRFEGSTGRASVLLGGLVNLSTNIGSGTRISVNTSYNRTADNDARREVGESENLGGRFQIDRLRYVERTVLSAQVQGEHRLGTRHLIDWSASRSAVGRHEPDRSEIVYSLDVDPQGNPRPPAWFSASNEGAVRTFADLDETATETAANYSVMLGRPGRPHQIRVGGLYRRADRDADNRSYSIAATLPDAARELAPEAIFDGRFSGPGQSYFRVTPLSAGGTYTAQDRQVAGYLMVQYFLSSRLELLGGARVERSEVDVTTEPTVGAPVSTRPRYTDVLPSLALNFRMTETQTLRLAATQTLSRPEYRELSPVQYREVIGGENILGNADLKRALIRNFDARWEWYPNPAEVISVGVFAKRFSDPIERVYLATSGTRIVSFLNAESGANYGVEVEARKNLRFLSARLVNFSGHFNGTVMRSRIRIGDGLSSRLNDERAMVGQAPYVINTGLTYTSGSGAFSATALYNVVGRRIVNAAEAPLPDVYEKPRHLVDLAVRFPVLAGLRGKFDVKNLFDAAFEIEQGTVTREYYRTGRVLSVGLSWQP